MKIQCDVCNKGEAAVFCSADEAALCTGCDYRVHHANKLASKHHRFSLLNPTNKDAPLCDICQERRAFLFCKEDRAILCRECDVPIHTSNEHTRKHNRFLLTGVKLSSSSNGCDVVVESNKMKNTQPLEMTKKKDMFVSVSVSVSTPPPSIESSSSTPTKGSAYAAAQSAISGDGSTSSIAEYLLETLPGWHVEDLLDSSSAALPHGFCKNNNLSPFLDAQVENDLCNFTSDDLGIWVPQAPPPPPPPPTSRQLHLIDEQMIGFSKETKQVKPPNLVPKINNKRWKDHGFTVPHISPPSIKRGRSLW